MNKFNSLTKYDNTEVLYSKDITLDGVKALYQLVIWENIPHFSVVMLSKDIEGYSDKDLELLIFSKLSVWDTISIVHHPNGFTHCNYNFDFRVSTNFK